MSKSMLVNVVNDEESRIAIVADGRLEELSIETAQQEQIEGNIYKARIVKVIASLDAVFVDYGRERNGFLAAPDIHPQYFRGDKRDVDALHKGQDLLVQVKKGEIGNKGAALTTYVSLPGRHFVLMPLVSKRGVSRRIDDETTRKQLRQILDGSGIPEEMGYIARTAAEGRTKQELTRDAGYLLRLWKTIQARDKEEKAPALLYEETDIVIRTLRDYFTPSIEEVLIDNEDIYWQVEAFFEAVMPAHKKRLKLYQAQAPLFSKHNLEDQIASIYAKKVLLPSGGSLVIEQTEALVSIDVNSGRTTSGKDIEETAFIANKEAAEEAARQLRLRDMGGLIVIDFIDMRPAKNRSEVRKVLQKALKEDKARTDTGTISKFGLLELSRQRLKGVARAGAIQPCTACSGLGTIRTPESSALSVLRRMQLRLPRKGAVRQVLVGVPGPVASLLQNRHRAKLMDLESRFGTEILVFAEEALSANQFYLEYRAKDRPEVETDLPEGFNRARLLAPQGLPDLPQRPRRPTLYPLLEEEPDAIEVPAEPDTEPDMQEQEQAEARSGSGAEEAPRDPGKKRRKRRRRGGRGNGNRDEAEDSSATESGDDTRFPAVGSGHAAAETAAAEADAEAAEMAAGSEPRPLSPASKRRQRRKRATGRTGESGSPASSMPEPTEGRVPMSSDGQVSRAQEEQERPLFVTVTDDMDDTDGTEALAVAPAAPSTDGLQNAEAPKRSRRKRRRKPRTADGTSREDAAASPAQAAGAPAAAAPEAEPPAVAPAAEEPPPAEKPKRARQPRKPKVAETTAAGTTEAAPAKQPADFDTKSTDTSVVEAPKAAPAKPRRTRKKAAAEEPAPADGETPAAETQPAKAPRKSRSRAKPKAEDTEATGSAEAGVPVTEKTPAKRATRARKAPAEPKAPAAPAPDGDAPAPKKTPRRRKTATTDQP